MGNKIENLPSVKKKTSVADWPKYLGFMFVGLIVLPMMFREPFIKWAFGNYISCINCIMVYVTVMLLVTKRDYTKEEVLLCIIWLLLLIPLWLSNEKNSFLRVLAEIMQCWMPVFLIIQRIDEERREKLVRISLYFIDVFTLLLLAIAIYEKLTGVSMVKAMEAAFTARGYRCSDLTILTNLMVVDTRFFSLWGHPLTNAVYFNAFFILNDIYYRSIEKRYPKFLFFLVAVCGVALAGSKTGIVVIGLALVITNWDNKKWFILYAAAAVALYFAGVFDMVVKRFTTQPLTTGRFTSLQVYFREGIYPLRFFVGYGVKTTYCPELIHLKAGFEFPLLMFALDNGILFSVTFLGSMFFYYTRRFLKAGQVKSWLMISLLFAEINTYNGISLYNQDCGWINAVILMLALNSVSLAKPQELKRRQKTVKRADKQQVVSG